MCALLVSATTPATDPQAHWSNQPARAAGQGPLDPGQDQDQGQGGTIGIEVEACQGHAQGTGIGETTVQGGQGHVQGQEEGDMATQGTLIIEGGIQDQGPDPEEDGGDHTQGHAPGQDPEDGVPDQGQEEGIQGQGLEEGIQGQGQDLGENIPG